MRDTEELCGRRSVSLRGALQSQANRFVHRFHEERKTKLRCAAGCTRTCKAWCSCCNASTCCHMMQMMHSCTTWTVGHQYGHLHLNLAKLQIIKTGLLYRALLFSCSVNSKMTKFLFAQIVSCKNKIPDLPVKVTVVPVTTNCFKTVIYRNMTNWNN